MEKVTLSEETIKDLAGEIVERFFQRCESLLIDEKDAGLLSLLLQDYLEQVERRRSKEEKKRDRVERLRRINDIPLIKPHNPYEEDDEQNRSFVNVAALNRSHGLNKGRIQ